MLAAVRVHIPVALERPRHLQFLYSFRQCANSSMTSVGSDVELRQSFRTLQLTTCVKTERTLSNQGVAVVTGTRVFLFTSCL